MASEFVDGCDVGIVTKNKNTATMRKECGADQDVVSPEDVVSEVRLYGLLCMIHICIDEISNSCRMVSWRIKDTP